MTNTIEFPLFALPSRLRAAVEEVHQYTGAPVPLIAVSAIAALSTAVQGRYMVERPGGLTSPVSLYFLVAADSGERKSAVDKLFMKVQRDFERQLRDRTKEEEAAYQGELMSWRSQVNAIRRKIEKEVENTEIDQSANTERLRELMARKPQPPQSPRILYEDCTSAAFKDGLAQWPHAAVISDEAQTVLQLLMRDSALLNGLWGGSELVVDRKASESISVENPRLTLALMVQPSALGKFMRDHGDATRGIGLWARFLFCYPVSTQGFRHNAGIEPEWTQLNGFNELVLSLLEKQLASSGDAVVMLQFSPEAKSTWLGYVNNIERRMQPGMDYHSIKDYASKVGENLARLAALFHIATSPDHMIIDEKTIVNAQEVMYWFFEEFRRHFDESNATPQYISDANLLYQWLYDRCWSKGFAWIKKNHARQFCPNALRKQGRFQAALQHLVQTGQVWLGCDPTGTGLRQTLVIKPIIQTTSWF